MIYNGFEITVLVKGRPINEYYHNLQTYIEGRDSSQFEIRLKNHTARKVEAVVSVDGLSVIDGKDAGQHSAGYLLEAYETLDIPGWKLSDEQVAAFVFAGKKKSYAAQSTGSARNTGVIGVMVFSERNTVHHNNIAYQLGQLQTQQANQWVNTSDPYHGAMIGSFATGSAQNVADTSMVYGINNISTTCSASPMRSNIRTKSVTLQNTRAYKGIAPSAASEPVEQTLGTAFGQAQEFQTTTVSFQRGDMVALMVVYYDDSRGLKARGIEIVRPSKRVVQAPQPQAFPAMSCKPPPGWEG